ncbi:MAG: hypothetical protein RIA62_15875 [Cyclobacteriaceae bacterium]
MKRLLVFTAILLLAGTGYFTYQKWVKHADLSPWSFLPQNAVMVYESDHILERMSQFQDFPVWQNISRLPPFSSLSKNLYLLDTIAGKGTFSKVFEDASSLISVHITSSSTSDLLFITEIENISQHTYLSKALAYFRDRGFKKKTREYMDFTITEISHPNSGESFAYIFFKNYFIGSFTAFLVEDAIRTIADDDYPSFSSQHAELFQVAKLDQDAGNIYFNSSRLSDILGTVGKENISFNLANSSFLDLKLTEDAINLNGFTFTSDNRDFLSIFNRTRGAAFDMAEIIPGNAAWMYHLTFDNNEVFKESMNDYLMTTSPGIFEIRNKILGDYDFDIEHTYTLLDSEIGIVTVESASRYLNEKLLILEVNDMGEALRFFNTMTERYATSVGDSIYIEQYGEQEIRRLPTDNFPQLMLGNIAAAFDQSYYMNYRNYLIFSNSIYQLKTLLKNIEDEEVWNKSLRFNRFLDRTNNEANFSLYVNTPRSWSKVLGEMKPDWVEYASNNQQALRNMEYLGFQFSNIDGKYYTNITLYQPPRFSSGGEYAIEVEKAISLSDKVSTKPYLVTNHYTKQKEVILQDIKNNVYLISSDFEALWSVDAGSQVTSDFFQIDYYRNGKLQYAFSTAESIHVIDRTGEYLPGFPVKFGEDITIATFNIVDYDNSRNYRYAISDTKGNLYLTNKDGKILEGWGPLPLESPITSPLRHIRVSGRDFMVALQQNGSITFKTRRAENYPGFPIKTETNTSSDFNVNRGNNFTSTYFSTVTGSGELFEVNFSGKVTKREQLYRPTTDTKFSVVNDITGDGFLILRNTDRRYEVLDEDGNVLFEKDYFSKSPMLIQYYKLGGSVEWIAFVDATDQNLYIYNRSGQLITGGPLRSGVPISVLQFENYYEIYLAEDNQLSVIRVIK